MSALLAWALLVTTVAVVACTLLLRDRWRRKRTQRQERETEQQLRTAQHRLDVAQATEAERRRIYDDLHDDVGGKLLTLLHRVKDPAQVDLVRDVLQDLRDIVSRSRSISGTLLEVLALLRDESERRLDALGVTLDWQQADATGDPPLDDAQAMHLFRIGREAITNALRHARPRHLRVIVARIGDELLFEVTDDGRFFDADRLGAGRGTRSMRARADELHGDITWLQGTQGGTKVRLRFPLPRDPTSAG
jgi:signal transduction histidine kinase